MKIYTKTGDQGKTSLFGGDRVSKDNVRIEAYGTVDEVNSVLGVAEVAVMGEQLKNYLQVIQHELFQLGSELATPPGRSTTLVLLNTAQIQRLEAEIDVMESSLSPLTNFILPGGSEGAARLHLARSVCRRAERRVIALHEIEPVRSEVIQYLNRLADHLFVCARYANFESGLPDVAWKKNVK